MSRIDFQRVAQAALGAAPSLLAEWLPGGRVEGDEFKALNPTRADSKIGSFSVNLRTGRWGDFATGEAGGDLVALRAYLTGATQLDAARDIAVRLGLGGGEGAAPVASPGVPPRKPRSEWVPIVPVPDEAPRPHSFDHPHYGPPEGCWAYRDRGGELLGYIRRYRNSDGGKEILPLTWCGGPDGSKKWHPVAFPVPRPLYGLDRLDADTKKPVLVVEGEKCADAAHELLGETFDVLSWPGGAKAVRKADWSALSGRNVLIWPDADAQSDKTGAMLPLAQQPGTKAAEEIASLLAGAASKVRIVVLPPPGERPPGWDVADAVAEGWDAERAAEFLRRQREPATVSAGASTPGPAGAGSSDEAWRAKLIWSGRSLKDCRENVIYVLREHPAWRSVLGADTFAKRIVVRRDSPIGHRVGAEWTPNDDVALGLWMTEQPGLLVRSPDTMSSAVRFVARESPFHPVREYLGSLRWDEKARVDRWAVECLGAEDSPYHRLVGRYFMINLVRRIFEPGCLMRSVPVLEGPQDRGKSRSLRVLAAEWFSDTPFRVGDKDAYQQIQGCWLYEISELDSFNRSEATAVKAFVSSTEDNFRAPYERQNEKHARQTVFAATTNASEYLKDWTGNTRFWPLLCGEVINLDLLAEWRDQLFAEAVHLYRMQERSHPTGDEQQRLFGPEQDARMQEDAWRPIIYGWLNPAGGAKDEVTVQEVLLDCLKVATEKMSPQGQDAQRVSRALHSFGWRKVRVGGRLRQWKWRRHDDQGMPEDDDGDIPF